MADVTSYCVVGTAAARRTRRRAVEKLCRLWAVFSQGVEKIVKLIAKQIHKFVIVKIKLTQVFVHNIDNHNFYGFLLQNARIYHCVANVVWELAERWFQ